MLLGHVKSSVQRMADQGANTPELSITVRVMVAVGPYLTNGINGVP